MNTTRREFIKSVGVTLASLVVAGGIPACASQRSDWDELRQHWLDLDHFGGGLFENLDTAEAKLEEKKVAHRATLDALVAAGEVDVAVADQIQIAFDEAAFHVWRIASLMTCYLPSELGMAYMRGRGDLVRQAELLTEIARTNEVGAGTVVLAQAALELDIAFFEAVIALQAQGLDNEARLEAERELVEQFEAGDIEISPETIEAARILVDLLLGGIEQ
jgi:hypothetical protein